MHYNEKSIDIPKTVCYNLQLHQYRLDAVRFSCALLLYTGFRQNATLKKPGNLTDLVGQNKG